MFGITKSDIVFANRKLKAQREYMQNATFTNCLGEPKTLLDISMSANLSKKYYAEVSNRVNTLASFSIIKDQTPVFLTITLNGCFRGALCGDYSKFKPMDFKYIPHELKQRMKNNEPLAIKDLASILNYQWHLLIMRYNKKHKGSERSYVRCFEPHKKDGVPHIHALFYLPADTIPYLLEIYKDLFYARQNLRTNAITAGQAANGEINGFQWSINNPTGYVMKYIQKTFINQDKSEELDALGAWYVKHKIRRFITSRTQIPLWVYRKINFISTFRDFYHLCNSIYDDENIIEWNYDDKYINIYLAKKDESITLENGTITHKVGDEIRNVYTREVQPPKNERLKLKDFSRQMVIDRARRWRDEFLKENGGYKKPLNRLKNFQLVSYYQNLDKQNCNIQHLAYIENLMIDRNLELFVKTYIKHDLNSPSLESFIERDLREYEF